MQPGSRASDTAKRFVRRLTPRLAAGVAELHARASGDATPVPSIEMAPDVTDRDEIFSFLGAAHVFDNEAEARGYLNDAIDRFRITMALIPELEPGARVLELGANPYFLTRLLRRRNLDVTCANYFGETYAGPLTQRILHPDVEERFEFDHFNIESDRFPYEDDSFDLVLFCEILEHLPCDPIHTLAEIHRVAAPGATVIVTTPNASRLTNLARIWRGENVYEDLSGYGTYGRHNREYTVDELERLMVACGYEVDRVLALDLHPPTERLPVGIGLATDHRGDNLFAVATPNGAPRWPYPAWLYSSRHALARVVRTDLACGHNDVLQARGMWDAEVVGGLDVCWMGASPTALVTLAPETPTGRIGVKGIAAPSVVGEPIELHVRCGKEEARWSIACDGRPFEVTGVFALPGGPSDVIISTDRQWSPAAVGAGADGRTLSLAVHHVTTLP